MILFQVLAALSLSLVPRVHFSDAAAIESNERRHEACKVAIFKEDGFPSSGTPSGVTPEWVYANLPRTCQAAYVDTAQLQDKGVFNVSAFDLLILPYGENFPFEAHEQIMEFIFEGGGLFNLAGRPLWAPLVKKDGSWKAMAAAYNAYDEFLVPLGIKYYELPDAQRIGLSVTTSLGFSPVVPTHGNIFPYRIPARDFYPLDYDENAKGGNPLIMVKSWRNPYREDAAGIPHKWCLIGARGEDHPLRTGDAGARDTLMRIIRCLSFPVILHELETDLAAYNRGEKIQISIKAVNRGRLPTGGTVTFSVIDSDGRTVFFRNRTIRLMPGQEMVLRETWHPKALQGSFYSVEAALKEGNEIVERERNGFVAINSRILNSGPSFEVKDKEFIVDNAKATLIGVNYYESKRGELMWVKPDLLRIRSDFKAMREAGINFIRIHYHHSKWFRDYYTQVLKKDLDPFLQKADMSALPSARSLSILDAIIQLAQEQGLIVCLDIFSLVPVEMGNPLGWLGLEERIRNARNITMQKKFVQIISARYRDVPGLTWDLWNEPRLEESAVPSLRKWAREMKEAFRENGDRHLITIGDEASLGLLDVLDYASIHTYEPRAFADRGSEVKPFMFQEIWNDAPCDLQSELAQAEKLKSQFADFLKTGAGGFLPWQWTRQARLWNASSSERWDDELGLCTHDDGTVKPAGNTLISLICTLRQQGRK